MTRPRCGDLHEGEAERPAGDAGLRWSVMPGVVAPQSALKLTEEPYWANRRAHLWPKRQLHRCVSRNRDRGDTRAVMTLNISRGQSLLLCCTALLTEINGAGISLCEHALELNSATAVRTGN